MQKIEAQRGEQDARGPARTAQAGDARAGPCRSPFPGGVRESVHSCTGAPLRALA